MTDRNLGELPDGERAADGEHYEPPSLDVIGSIEELTLLEEPVGPDQKITQPN